MGVYVRPSTDMRAADAIEDVVIKRGGQVVRANRREVTPVTISNLAGGSRELTTGTFYFDMATFQPTAEITIVLIGRTANFEWTIRADELSAMR